MRRGEQERAGRLLLESAELFGTLGNPVGIGQARRRLVALAAESGQPERAARLLGAAAVVREGSGASFASGADVDSKAVATRVQDPLGEQAAAAARAAGRKMTLEQAVVYALEEQSSE
jgi:hypothetical protein